MWMVGAAGNQVPADSGTNDTEGQESAYMYKWPWMDQRAYNMAASGIEGDCKVIHITSHIQLVSSRSVKSVRESCQRSSFKHCRTLRVTYLFKVHISTE